MNAETFQGPVMLAAFLVSRKARFGGLTRADVDDLRTKAEELMKPDDDFRPAVMTFATMYEIHHRDPVALAALGEDLDRAITYVTAPAPGLPFRSDLDG